LGEIQIQTYNSIMKLHTKKTTKESTPTKKQKLMNFQKPLGQSSKTQNY